MKQALQRVLDYIEENLKSPIEAEELADMCGYSLFHFYRLFRAVTGMPVMQYVLRRKLLHAIYEMKGNERRIDIVLEYGFETYAGFYRAFQRMFQYTPSQYLERGLAKIPYRLNLTMEENMYITHKKAAEMLKHWNMESEHIQDIYYDVTGNHNENAYAVGEDYILKFTANLGKVLNHQRLSSLMDAAGLNAAVSVPATDGKLFVQEGEYYFYLTRRVKGRQMNALQMYEPGKAAYVGELIGQLHKALKDAESIVEEADIFKTIREWAIGKAKTCVPLTEEFCAEYLSAIENYADVLPRQPIHRDPNPGNIIVNGNEWGFIDFELGERNIRLYDPCYAATAVLSETYNKLSKEDDWFDVYQDILEGYDSIVHLTMEEKKMAPYVVLGNQMICVAFFSTEEKYREIYETNVNMFRFLLKNKEKLNII